MTTIKENLKLFGILNCLSEDISKYPPRRPGEERRKTSRPQLEEESECITIQAWFALVSLPPACSLHHLGKPHLKTKSKHLHFHPLYKSISFKELSLWLG